MFQDKGLGMSNTQWSAIVTRNTQAAEQEAKQKSETVKTQKAVLK
jgi:hypothetical protein